MERLEYDRPCRWSWASASIDASVRTARVLEATCDVSFLERDIADEVPGCGAGTAHGVEAFVQRDHFCGRRHAIEAWASIICSAATRSAWPISQRSWQASTSNAMAVLHAEAHCPRHEAISLILHASTTCDPDARRLDRSGRGMEYQARSLHGHGLMENRLRRCCRRLLICWPMDMTERVAALHPDRASRCFIEAARLDHACRRPTRLIDAARLRQRSCARMNSELRRDVASDASRPQFSDDRSSHDPASSVPMPTNQRNSRSYPAAPSKKPLRAGSSTIACNRHRTKQFRGRDRRRDRRFTFAANSCLQRRQRLVHDRPNTPQPA